MRASWLLLCLVAAQACHRRGSPDLYASERNHKGCSAAASTANDSALVRELSYAWSDAYRRGDTAWYARNLADDAVTILPNGSTRTRQESIAALSRRNSEILAFELVPDLITVSRDLAVETGSERISIRSVSGDRDDRRYRYTVVYVRQGCRWKGLLNHATAIQ